MKNASNDTIYVSLEKGRLNDGSSRWFKVTPEEVETWYRVLGSGDMEIRFSTTKNKKGIFERGDVSVGSETGVRLTWDGTKLKSRTIN